MKNSNVIKTQLFSTLPAGLRDELIDVFQSINTNYIQGRFEPSELNGGKLCEVIYTILKGYTDGNYPDRATKPSNMVVACQQLEQTSSTFPRSIRIQIPRILLGLYEIRNNRGVGHVGGDVNPNIMDATCVLYMSKWLVSELIRIFHNVTIKEAESLVDAIMQRLSPQIWEIDGSHRVLDTSLSYKDQTLLLLYHLTFSPSESELCNWLEHSNPSVYRSSILKQLHKKRLIEYTITKVSLSPIGIKYTEKNLICA
ncbi:hypothetical protein EFP84_18735 [Leptospira kmetyi]|uniref:Uncharacterized protein n=1 Tax=Leptospira kmetyi TaxID=408139 RepID=A0AAD0XRS7_9LEPT|nr:hypothetical protein [Leptospira kmetyi]AYV57682.1 hypothetical protein EFP84_18735 [Leptospira kmetyi]